MRSARLAALSAALLLASSPLAVFAKFPDVPSSYPHAAHIDVLVGLGVINGNPDGTFRPYDPVDRAAMLKMLYKAAKVAPDASAKKCLKDVAADSWYESYVCDAVARGWVSGYQDKTFKPGKPVTRAEAVKLTVVIMGLGTRTAAAAYTDVPSSEWFHPYVQTAIARGVLPIAGQDGSQFQPHALLMRGEAAAYIAKALNPANTGAASSAAASSAGPTQRELELQRQRDQEAALKAEAAKNTFSVSYPFTERKIFTEKQPMSFRFSLSASVVTDITAALEPNEKGGITCRLYRLESDGFSTEYYLGFIDGTRCLLRTALTAGDYQLQVQPTSAGTKFSVNTKAAAGDGNDGFSQAKPLILHKVRHELLGENDLEDWYAFDIPENPDFGGTKRTVRVTSTANVECIIYPLANVDLFGFAAPECNKEFLFPKGSYKVAVRHMRPYPIQQGYSVELK